MVNYSEGKIYKIVCNITGDIYIGSTCEKYLKNRIAKHKANYKQYKKGSIKRYTTSYKILENNNYDIILIENYKCNSKDELHARERYYIENTNCINKYIPGRTKKEYMEKYSNEHKNLLNTRSKEWYKNNKDKKKEYDQKYRDDNKEKYKKYFKKYRDDNKDLIKTKSKEWYKNNKDKKKEYDEKYRDDNKERYKKYFKKRNDYLNSWGGNKNYNNNLLEIDINLFL